MGRLDTRRRFLVLSGILVAVLLASCGQPTAPVATTAPTSAPAPVASATAGPAAACEIKMGLLFSLTGDLGDIAQAQLPAEEMAIEEINAAGG